MQRLTQLFEEHGERTLTIPDYGFDNEIYPGNLKPGYYSREEVAELIDYHKDDSEAVQFLANTLEL